MPGGQGRNAVPGGWVKVKWDVGNHGQYYTGYQDRFDLRFLPDDVGEVGEAGQDTRESTKRTVQKDCEISMEGIQD
jgi:hypothetical protein